LDWYSIIHDQGGNFYVSEGFPSEVQKVDSNLNILATYTPAGGAVWITLASGQHTIVYGSTSGDIKSFDVQTQTQGPDLVLGVNPWTVRMLPDSSLLVDSGGVVTRWAAPCPGCYPYTQVFSYALPESADSLALDPDGLSFWTVHTYCCIDDIGSGGANVYRIAIKTGQLMTTFPTVGGVYGMFSSGSIGIYGDGMNSTASSTPALKFGSQLVGTSSAPKTVSIKNTGMVEMIVSNVVITGDFVISKNLCKSGIRPGTHCNVWVQFQPTQLGSRSGTLSVYDNATSSPQTTNLSGSGATVSSTTLTSSPNPSVQGQAVIFTAQVTSNAPNPPTGTVTFKNGSLKIGKATLNAGVATMTTSGLPVGSLSITATYNGDSENLKSTSPVLTQVVNPR
jgi:hypothetical protein